MNGGGANTAARYTGQTFNHISLGTMTVGLFGEDVVAHTDRDYQWNSIKNNGGTAIGFPSYLQNKEYVLLGTDRRDDPDYTLTLSLSQPAWVYLIIDNRGGPDDADGTDPPSLGTGLNGSGEPFMQWVLDSGFGPIRTGTNRTGSTAVPDEIGLDRALPSFGVGAGESIDEYYSIYGKMVTTGSIVLGEYDAGQNVGRDMYGVVVTVPEPCSAALLIGGVLSLFGIRSQRANGQQAARSS